MRSSITWSILLGGYLTELCLFMLTLQSCKSQDVCFLTLWVKQVSLSINICCAFLNISVRLKGYLLSIQVHIKGRGRDLNYLLLFVYKERVRLKPHLKLQLNKF